MDLTLMYLLLFGLFLLLAGYFLPSANHPAARLLSWSLAILTVFFSVVITKNETSLYRMVAIVSLQLLSMKAIVAVERYPNKNNLSFIQWCGFALGWFGMRPALFENLPSRPLPNFNLLVKGMSRILIGILLLYFSALTETWKIRVFFLSELLLLSGLSLILHFGVLNLSTAGWRLLGVDVKELFLSPYKSKSLKEFWGKRWNVAFSEMTAIIAYRPLKDKFGTTKAMIISFLLSGLLHEIAISFPVNSGFGLPLLYFAIHAVIMYLEGASSFVKKIISHPVFSRVWVFAWLIIPMPLLFHVNFFHRVLIPMREMILDVIS